MDPSTPDPRDAVRASLLRVVPDAPLEDVGPEEDLRDALELDSLDFLAYVENLTKATGARFDEDDYPALRTLTGASALVGHRLGLEG